MTDRLDFERQLEARLRARAAVASRPFDAATIAHQAVVDDRRRRWIGRLEWPTSRPALGWLIVGLLLAIALLGAIGVGAGALLSPSRAPSPSPAPASKIAFYSDRTGTTEIYVMNADGSGQTNVSHGPGDFSAPDGAWSPDGSRIAFTSDRDGNLNVYVVNADGSGLANVSNDPCGAGGPRWSPDGSRIAFSSGPTGYRGDSNPPPAAGDCGSTIYVVNADGSGRTNLTNGPAQPGGWSPDGSRFAFISDRGGNWDVYAVNVDGSGLTNLSNDPGFDDFSDNTLADGPAWSPDSSRVSFVSDRECKVAGGKLDVYVVNADGSGLTNLGNAGPIINGGVVGCAPSDPPIRGYDPDAAHVAFVEGFGDGKGEELFVMNADGSGLTRLTNNAVDDHNLVWSPDMSRIAWHRSIAGNTEIWVVNPDGSGQTRLSIGPEGDALRDGGWSPDSSRIAFGSNRDGNGEIYLVNANGSGLTNLTNNPGEDGGPVWSPGR